MHVVKRNFSSVFWHAPCPNMYRRDLINCMGFEGACAPCLPRDVIWQVAESVHYTVWHQLYLRIGYMHGEITQLTSSCPDDIGVVLQFQEYFEATENIMIKNPLHIRPCGKRGGFTGVLGVAQWGQPKLRCLCRKRYSSRIIHSAGITG